MLVPALVVGLATALRLAWVLLVPTRPVGDFAMFLESAAHLVEYGALDPEFVYMPGYVFLLALVKAAGGGVLAAKLVAVALGGLGAGAVYGIAHHLWDRRAALVAGLLYALWPAGIAVSSVTGTDFPAAVLGALAAWCLVRWGPRRPELAAVLFGVGMGAAAWIRAVMLPLAALSAFYFRASGGGWVAVARRTAVACLAAAVVLAPWAVRNRLRYGEAFFTDSHGGLTALVGANPDSEGTYSRSLNRMFLETTGYRLLAEPHREADRASYQIARDFTAFEPAYAIGLLAAKAERLLDTERPLLYWPLFRAGVLPEPYRSWFAARRRPLENVVDAFWVLLVGASVFGLGVAAARRRWVALSFVPMQVALIGIYVLFFAEVRYRLPIVLLMFPPAGGALVWLFDACQQIASPRPGGPGLLKSPLLRQAAVGGALVLALFVSWPLALAAGKRLRDNHRWAASVCHLDGAAHFCKWQRDPAGPGPSPVRGVWNGVGLALVPGAGARAPIASLPPGRYRIRADLDLAGPAAAGTTDTPLAPDSVAGTAWLRAGSAPVAGVPLTLLDEASRAGRAVHFQFVVDHPGGLLAVHLALALGPGGEAPSFSRLWLSDLRVDWVPPPRPPPVAPRPAAPSI